MSKFIIAYDLNKDETREDYESVIAALKSFGIATHQQYSVWTLETTYSQAAIIQKLSSLMIKKDRLFVAPLLSGFETINPLETETSVRLISELQKAMASRDTTPATNQTEILKRIFNNKGL